MSTTKGLDFTATLSALGPPTEMTKRLAAELGVDEAVIMRMRLLELCEALGKKRTEGLGDRDDHPKTGGAT